MTRAEIANRIKHRLVDLDWSQAELARRIGVTEGRISQLLRWPDQHLSDNQAERIDAVLKAAEKEMEEIT